MRNDFNSSEQSERRLCVTGSDGALVKEATVTHIDPAHEGIPARKKQGHVFCTQVLDVIASIRAPTQFCGRSDGRVFGRFYGWLCRQHGDKPDCIRNRQLREDRCTCRNGQRAPNKTHRANQPNGRLPDKPG
jgi:hypothetical protein